DLDACCERLIELAKAGGGHDNVTVILCEFGGEGLAQVQPGDLAGYQQYPLPLDTDSRNTGPVHSEVPTLAPPGTRGAQSGAYTGFGKLTADGAWGIASAVRYAVLALILLAIVGAVYYWRGAGEGSAVSPELTPAVELPAAEDVTPRVEVVVRTDVEGGELFVDGESYGKAEDGRWVLDLLPGPHKLEARAGGSS